MTAQTREESKFELVSVDRCQPPSGSDGDDWYCYRINRDDNTITGYRRGSLRAVKREAQLIVVGLNERRDGKRKATALKTHSGQRAKS
jgi:hypothetical protein